MRIRPNRLWWFVGASLLFALGAGFILRWLIDFLRTQGLEKAEKWATVIGLPFAYLVAFATAAVGLVKVFHRFSKPANTSGQEAADAMDTRREVRLQVGLMPPRAAHYVIRSEQAVLDQARANHREPRIWHVISGMAGTGKTQLAVNTARKLWEAKLVDVLVWINASSTDQLVSSYADAANRLGIGRDLEPSAAAIAFMTWMGETSTPWLVVLDDATDAVSIADWLPPKHNSVGRTFITTKVRDAGFRSIGTAINVSQYSPHQSQAYLETALSGLLTTDGGPLLAEAAELAEDLGHLPIALAHAAAFIENRQVSCKAFRSRLRTHKALPGPGNSPAQDEKQRTVAATLMLSVEAANSRAPEGLASETLRLASTFNSAGVPIEVLSAPPALIYLSRTWSSEAGQVADAATVRDALANLRMLHLAEIDMEGVHIHGLVQNAALAGLTETDLRDAVVAAADALVAAWPESDGDIAQPFRANAATLRRRFPHVLIGEFGIHRVVNVEGGSYGRSGRPRHAFEYFSSLHTQVLALLGAESAHVLHIRGEQAMWQGESGDAAGALTATEELLADQIGLLGPTHTNTMTTRGNIAHWLGRTGDTNSAVTHLEQVLAAQSDSDPNDPQTLAIRQNLAYWRGQIGDRLRAVEEAEAVVADQIAALGTDDKAQVLTARNNLAVLRGQAGDISGAIRELVALLPDQTRALGKSHPETLTTRNNIAYWLGQSGDAAAALLESQRLLTDQLEWLSDDHPETLTTRNNIAHWHNKLGHTAEALFEFQSLVPDLVRVFGPHDPKTAITINSLAKLLSQQPSAGSVA